MKKIITPLLLVLATVSAVKAQVPYFAGTVGDGRLYGYTSVKFRPGINAQETYTTFQYGVTNFGAAGLDLYTSNGSAYTGFLIRGGYKLSKWFNVGAQITPSFNLSDNFRFSYLTGAVYLNGNISRDGKFFWCSNAWLTINDGAKDTYMNWEYLGMNIPTTAGQSVTPMVGAIHSWKFDQDVDLALGAYYSIKNWDLYLWGNDIFKSHPRVVVGVDLAF